MKRGGRFALIILLAAGYPAAADELLYAVKGIGEPLLANVLAHVETVQLGQSARLAEKDFPEIIEAAAKRARAALRPFGYYRPDVRGRIEKQDAESLRLTLDIKPGPPMIVATASITLRGEGADIEELRDWRDGWPLKAGTRLDQTVWERQKVDATERAESRGFLGSAFPLHLIELDLEQNRAVLRLIFDTGPRYMFGDIDFGEHILKPGILEYTPRFSKGEPYSSRLLDTFRSDLWKTGYFTNIEIKEVRRGDQNPPTVDLNLKLEMLHRNSYQGSLGFGTDTGFRTQAQWSRNPMSRNGARMDVGIGWQDRDDEFLIRTNYRRPRLVRGRQFWSTELTFKLENLDLEVKRSPEDEDFIKIANGDVTDLNLRFGRLNVRDRKRGDQQIFSTPFIQYLSSDQQYELLIPSETDDYMDLLNQNDNAISIGYSVDLVDVWGKGFETAGRRDRVWVFTANKSLGSDTEFTQAYASTSRILRPREQWKVLLRGEVGYTDAHVESLSINVDTATVDLSLTELPSFYRFKAGGGQSVRGYGYETLNNNDVGSNNIVTASIEVERRILNNWSMAAFFDIGNAFNDWGNMDLYKGVGLGVRWYSIAGPIRIDVAQALDFEGNPWRLHLTIGTPLL